MSNDDDKILNMSSYDVEERVKALHENLDHALSCLSGMQQPMMSTDRMTKEEEAEGHAQMEQEMFEALETILSAFYGKNGSGFVFKV